VVICRRAECSSCYHWSRHRSLITAITENTLKVSAPDPHGRILGFQYRNCYYFFQVTPHSYSRGLSGPRSRPITKSGSVGNRTRALWICSQELWPLDISIRQCHLTAAVSASRPFLPRVSFQLIYILQGGPDSIRQFLIINNQSIQEHTGKWESTFCCR
jgi:hypothetical protein